MNLIPLSIILGLNFMDGKKNENGKEANHIPSGYYLKDMNTLAMPD